MRVPIEVVKQRRQTRADVSARQILQRTLTEEGVRGLYRGLGSTIAREVPFAIIQVCGGAAHCGRGLARP